MIPLGPDPIGIILEGDDTVAQSAGEFGAGGQELLVAGLKRC